MQLSCAFAPSPRTPDHIVRAEELGYHRAWCYDSPALYTDVWVTLALAATRTSSIGLGPGVLVSNLRHVMANAAAVATLVDLAPGRVTVAVGSGFTGARCLGQKPQRWRDVTVYIEALRALLRGEEVAWDGAVIRMMHPAGFAPARPDRGARSWWPAAGPKGVAAAKAVGDGVFFGGAAVGRRRRVRPRRPPHLRHRARRRRGGRVGAGGGGRRPQRRGVAARHVRVGARRPGRRAPGPGVEGDDRGGARGHPPPGRPRPPPGRGERPRPPFLGRRAAGRRRLHAGPGPGAARSLRRAGRDRGRLPAGGAGHRRGSWPRFAEAAAG